MRFGERALSFECEGERLCGILSEPAQPRRVGLLVVVGGPQYRVGSHRQFVLLGRRLAAEGIPVLRFDCRGMGDSTGPMRSFDDVDADVAAALDAFAAACPGIDRFVLWGLCDAASAELMYCFRRRDRRVAGLVLLNPWVRSEASLAKAHVKHYYVRRLLEREFWVKLLSGGVDLRDALGSLVRALRLAGQGSPDARDGAPVSYQDQMAEGLRGFAGPVLLILSGRDLTAKEFLEHARGNLRWSGLIDRPNVARRDLPDADHTFSSARWRGEVERMTLEWIDASFGSAAR